MAALALFRTPSEAITCHFFNVYVIETAEYVLHHPDIQDFVKGESEEFGNFPGDGFNDQEIVSLNKKNFLIPNLFLKCWITWTTKTVQKMHQLTHLLLFMTDLLEILRFLSMSLLTSWAAFVNYSLYEIAVLVYIVKKNISSSTKKRIHSICQTRKTFFPDNHPPAPTGQRKKSRPSNGT